MGFLGLDKAWDRLTNASGASNFDIGMPDWLNGDTARGWMTGGIPGAIGGYQAGKQRSEAEAMQRQALDQAMMRQERLRKEMEARRQRDLNNTMGMFQPALQAMTEAYGIPMSAWGQAIPANQPPAPPPRTGMIGGQQVTAAPLHDDMQGLGQPLGGRPRPLSGVQRTPTRPLGDMFRRPLR